MGKYNKKIIMGLLLAAFSAGIIFWFYKHEPGSLLKICIAALILLVGGFVYLRNVLDRKRDLRSGNPAEDEFTKLVRLHAGSKAFMISMYLWFIIFIFHSYFSNQEEILGIGILGSALIYGLCILYFRKTGCTHEK